jgi:hypothetical protein
MKLSISGKSKFTQFYFNVDPSMGYTKKDTIRIMSSYEWKAVNFLVQLYKAGRIKSWVSEATIFEYTYVIDGKQHKYFMDFTCEMIDGSTIFIEVKPSAERQPPRKPKKGDSEAYRNAIQTYIKNQNKWEAVEQYCLRESTEFKKYKFVIWDEYTLKIK